MTKYNQSRIFNLIFRIGCAAIGIIFIGALAFNVWIVTLAVDKGPALIDAATKYLNQPANNSGDSK